MSPLTNRAEAKEGGFGQVREALVAFEGDVVEVDARGQKTEFAQWGTAMTGNDGKPRPPKEFLQVVTVNVVPTEVTEDLSMDITEGWTFRVNCSDYKGSFWVDAFLESAERNKVQIPEGLIGKRIQFRKFTLEAKDNKGEANPKFNSTNFIIEKVMTKTAVVTPKVVKTATTKVSTPVVTQPAEVSGEEQPADAEDPMLIALELAVGKTEQQFRSAVALHPKFINNPLLPLAKAGAVTQMLVNEKKLVMVAQGNKLIYQKA